MQDPQGSADVPLQALIGRLAGLLGAPAEVGNIVRSPQPMEMYGDVNYDPQTQLPYDTKYFNQRLPLQPTSRAGELAREAGSFVPLNPMPAVRAGQGVVRMAGQEITDVMSGLPARSALGYITPKSLNIVPPNVVRQMDMPVNLPTSKEFLNAVTQEPSAAITPEGLLMNVKRQQVPDQSGMESVRTGVFYLPESQSASVYKGKQGYGGSEPIQGSTLYKNPLFVKGATGGKAPESAYDQLLGKGSYQTMRNEALDVVSGYRTTNFERVEKTRAFLEKYGGDPDLADYIVENSKYGNQLTYALQENAVANAVRNAGHDAVLGYSKGRGDKGEFFSEVFDVREKAYPTPQGNYELMPQFEKLIKEPSPMYTDPFGNTIGESIR
jgi:hypothetical protein